MPTNTVEADVTLILSDINFRINLSQDMQLQICKRYEHCIKRMLGNPAIKLHVGEEHEIARSYFSHHRFDDFDLNFAVDRDGHNSAGVLHLLPELSGPFTILVFVTGGDINININSIIRQHIASNSVISILMEKEELPNETATSTYLNKSQQQGHRNIRFSNGVFVVSNALRQFILPTTSLAELVQLAIHAGMKVSGIEALPARMN